MKYWSFFVIVFVTTFISYPKEVKKVSAEYQYSVHENQSLEEAKVIALERAKIKAISDEFGTMVSQNASTYIETRNGETTTDFISIGGSELNGEWIETTSEPEYKILTDGEQLVVSVIVQGKIRRINGVKTPCEVKLLRNGCDDQNESSEFFSGDELRMSFRSPVAGYLAVYLIDADKQVYCLIPYQGQTDGCFLTKANQRHLLFDVASADNQYKEVVDELILDTTREKEYNRILTIFSPNKFFKANDHSYSIELPRQLDSQDFQKWLGRIRMQDSDMSINETIITIIKK